MPDHMPHEAKVEDQGLGTAKGALRSASNRQSAAQSDFQLMLQSMVDDGRLSAEKKVSMEAYVAKSVAEHNSGEETAWYEAMSSVNMEGFAELTAKGSPPAELLERVEDEYGAYFGPEVAARLRRSVLRWGSTAVGGGASAKGGGGGEGGGNIVVDAAGAGFLINGRPFLPWCDDQHLGDTLASDPTGTTVWNCAMVLAKLCECEDGRGSEVSPTVCGARVLELGAGVGLCGLAAARLGAAAVMLTDANKTTLDLLALNIAQESEAKAWAAGAKVDLNSWDWRKKPSRRVFGGKPEKGGGPYNTVLGSDLVYAATPMETIHHLVTAIDAALAPGGSAWLAVEKRRDSLPERDELLTALVAGGYTATEVVLPRGLGPPPCVSTVAVYRCERSAVSQVNLAGSSQPEPEPEVKPKAPSAEVESLRQARIGKLVGERGSAGASAALD